MPDSPDISPGPPGPGGISYWLMPDQPCRDALQQTVNALAERYSGPVFDPHLTLRYQPLFEGYEPGAAEHASASSSDPVELRCLGLAFSDRFTQACYLLMENTEVLRGIENRLGHPLPTPDASRPVPHMSLFYGHLSEHQRDEIRSAVDIPKSVVFDRIRAVSIPTAVRTAADVYRWRVVDECAFRIVHGGR